MQIKPESSPSRKSNQEYWLNHVKQWESSKLSQQVYCTQAEISYGTFVYWRGQFLLESGRAKSQKFVPVEIRQPVSETSQSVKIKLVTGNIICIPISIGIAEVAKLIRLLETSNA